MHGFEGGLDKENISEGFESTLMQNRGNLTPSPTGLYSSFSLRLDASRAANVRERERRGRRRMRYLPQHPPFWPFFHQMDGEVGAKKARVGV